MHERTRKMWATVAIVVTGLVFSCSSRSSREGPAGGANARPPDEMARWYQGCWNSFNEKKWDDFKKCYADRASSQQVGYGHGYVNGPDAIIIASQDFIKTFPDGRGDAQIILVNENHIASIYLLKGTNTGPILGINQEELPITKKKLGLLFAHYLEVDTATLKVQKELGIEDGLTLSYQLGYSSIQGRKLMENGAPMPTIVFAKNDATEMKNVETEKAQFEAWNKHNQTAVDSYEADDYILHDMTGPADLTKAQDAQENKAYWDAFSDARINTAAIWGAGDYVTAVGTFDGRNDGDIPVYKIKKTGKRVSLPFINIFRFEAGKLKEEWLFFDGSALIAQLK